jgi:tRNA-dihydrouridine synthase
MTSAIQQELEENIKQIRILINSQIFSVKDAESYLERYGNILLKVNELELSRDNWKAKFKKRIKK